MSTVRTYKVEVTRTVILKVINKVEIDKMIKSLSAMLVEKTDRLKNHLTSCTLTVYNNQLVILDELSITKDLEKIAEAYGMKIHKFEIDNKKAYVISDPILEILKLLDFDISNLLSYYGNYSEKLMKKINKQQLDEIIKESNSNEYLSLVTNKYLNESINKALNNEVLQVEKIDTILKRSQDGRELDSRLEGTKSDEHLYVKAIGELNNFVESINKKHKENIVNGTTRSIESRAKSMGYNVEQRMVEDKIQLVLVRSR
jgi:hypothetical protein